MRLRAARAGPLAGLLLVAACSAEGAPGELASACQIRQPLTPLPPELAETSGAAIGRRAAGLVWTHNDSGGEPEVFAVRTTGQLVARARVEGAGNRDWEDLAVGPCAAGSCLYIADTGDNEGRRETVDVYRLPEPDAAGAGSAPAERFRARYPGGPRDAEALFVLPPGEVYLVTKGRREGVEVYRYPVPLRAEETAELERVATLHPTARDVVLQVTGADASPDGRWVAVRAYGSLMVFRAAELRAGRGSPALLVDLGPVGERQGEGVAIADDGVVVLTSEGDSGGGATLAILSCALPA